MPQDPSLYMTDRNAAIDQAAESAMAGPGGPPPPGPEGAAGGDVLSVPFPNGMSPQIEAFVQALADLPPEQQDAVLSAIQDMVASQTGGAPGAPGAPPAQGPEASPAAPPPGM